jgi:hypothetical protein
MASEDSTEGSKCNLFRLDSALTRQLFYTTTRLGIYKTISAEVQKKNDAAG